MKHETEAQRAAAVREIRTLSMLLQIVPSQSVYAGASRHLNDYADLLEKEIAAGATNTRDESKENISTSSSITIQAEPVKFGEQERLRALQSMVISMGMSPELCARDIVRTVTIYLEEVLKP